MSDETQSTFSEADQAAIAAHEAAARVALGFDKPENAGDVKKTAAEEIAGAIPRPTGPNGEAIALPPSGIVSGAEVEARHTAEGFAHLETLHFPSADDPAGADLRAMLDGKNLVSPELLKRAEVKLRQLTNDKSWSSRLLSNDPMAMGEWHLACGIITAGRAQNP